MDLFGDNVREMGGKKSKKPPVNNGWQSPALFPEDAASVLKRSKLTKRQFSKHAEQFVLFLLANCSADFAISLQRMIRDGEFRGMEMFAKMAGMLKNESGVTVNLNQNNVNLNGGGGGRDFDSIIRALDARDKEQAVIEVASEPIGIEGPQ